MIDRMFLPVFVRAASLCNFKSPFYQQIFIGFYLEISLIFEVFLVFLRFPLWSIQAHNDIIKTVLKPTSN